MNAVHAVNNKMLIVVDNGKCKVFTADKTTLNSVVTTLGHVLSNRGRKVEPLLIAHTPSAKAPRRAGRAGRKPMFPKDYRIHLLVPSNPKRLGTHSHAEWELYQEGMTVAEYIAAVAGANLGSTNPKARGYAGVVHDARKGLIKVVNPKKYQPSSD